MFRGVMVFHGKNLHFLDNFSGILNSRSALTIRFINHQCNNDALMTAQDPRDFFLRPATPLQRKYDALREYYLERLSQREAAEKHGYTPSSFQSIVRDYKGQRLVFFLPARMGPKGRRTPVTIQEKIIALKKKNLSVYEIQEILERDGFNCSTGTINNILKEDGFAKLPRRTLAERGVTSRLTVVPPASVALDFDDLTDHAFDCQVGGIFYFVPYIIETDLYELLQNAPFPESSRLSRINSIFTILALKLMGHERLSKVTDYSLDTGLGFFAGLNVPPKTTATSTYSYRVDRDTVEAFLDEFMSGMMSRFPKYYKGETINLDFHSIPHYGELSRMDKNWVGAKHQRMKSALTFFAQDGESRMLLYEDADIRTSEASGAVMDFVDHWIRLRGIVDRTLVFDSKLTDYKRLEELDALGIKFITLRRRGRKLIEDAKELPEEAWEKVDLKKPKRKHNRFMISEGEVQLPRTNLKVRQLIFMGHGRELPTFLITNNYDIKTEKLALLYANRWLIENKFSELVDFFKMNALSSPFMIRIYFDVALTVVADTLYKLLAQDLRRFEDCTSKRIFSDFINCGCTGRVLGDEVMIRMKKKATTPLLKSQERYRRSWPVPWWGGKEMRYEWSA